MVTLQYFLLKVLPISHLKNIIALKVVALILYVNIAKLCKI